MTTSVGSAKKPTGALGSEGTNPRSTAILGNPGRICTGSPGLDVEMPQLNGIELCQVVRNDPHWSRLPVLFLSAHTDADTLNQVFAAGADDYVSKPIVGPELARIFNRLERSRLLRNMAEIDALTGVFNRRKLTKS